MMQILFGWNDYIGVCLPGFEPTTLHACMLEEIHGQLQRPGEH